MLQQDDLAEELPDEVLEQLEPTLREQIESGARDRLPEDAYDALPDSLQDRVPADLVAFADSNRTLTIILLLVGLLSIAGFLYGVAKSAFKAAGFFAIVGTIAWFWFANR